MASTELAVANLALIRIGHTKAVTNLASTTDAAAVAVTALFDEVRDQVLASAPWPFATKWAPLARLDAATVIWATAPTYATGSLVSYSDVDYVALRSTQGDQPDVSASDWRTIAYSATATYGAGDIVRSDATVSASSYVSLQASNLAHTPGEDGSETWWALLHDSFSYVYTYPSDCVALRFLYGGTRNPSQADSVPYALESNRALTANVICTDLEDARACYTARAETVTLWPASFVAAFSWRLASELVRPLSAKADLERYALERSEMEINRAFAQQMNAQQADQESSCPAVAARG